MGAREKTPRASQTHSFTLAQEKSCGKRGLMPYLYNIRSNTFEASRIREAVIAVAADDDMVENPDPEDAA